MPRFVLTLQAKNDYLNIGRYTQKEWDIEQRNLYLSSLDVTFQKLAEMPDLARQRNEIIDGLKIYPCGKHVVFFRVQGDSIEIVRILHQNMDLESHLI